MRDRTARSFNHILTPSSTELKLATLIIFTEAGVPNSVEVGKVVQKGSIVRTLYCTKTEFIFQTLCPDSLKQRRAPQSSENAETAADLNWYG